MDYSSIHQNDPAGDSPWATSPQHSRTNSEHFTHPDEASSAAAQMSTSTFADSSVSGSDTLVDSPNRSYGAPPNQQHQPPSPESPRGIQQQNPNSPQNQQQRPPITQRPSGQRYHAQRPGPRPPAPQYKLQARVTGLERAGRKDPILRFDIYTNLPDYRTTQFRDVRRTHSEFVKLGDHLISANPEALVPAVPPSATSAGVGTDEDEIRLKAAMQRWLNYVCGNDVLMQDKELVRFVEGDPGYSPVVKLSQPATGVRRKMLKQFAPPPDDTPELQDARPIVKMFYLGTMDASQKVDKVVRARRSLGLAESDLGIKLAALTEAETHPGLKHGLRKLGRTVQTAGDLHAAQGTAEATTLGDPLNYHSSDAFIVKETLTNRHILQRELRQAQETTRSKLAAADRLKVQTSVRRDKVDEAIAAFEEARSRESFLVHKTQRVTANLVEERRKWFARSAADLRASVREYVVREIEAERRTLATLEAVRPDIRAIDASGGLSRLGREAHPAARRATLMSSQGPKGDAWSGVPRRLGDGLNRSASGSVASFASALPVPPGSAGSQEGAGGDQQGDINGEGDERGRAGTEGGEGGDRSRSRAVSGSGSLRSSQAQEDEDDDDRVDAKNAASRLATSTF